MSCTLAVGSSSVDVRLGSSYGVVGFSRWLAIWGVKTAVRVKNPSWSWKQDDGTGGTS